MYVKEVSKGTVRFSVKPSRNAQRVQLAGSFNGWNAAQMKKQKDGTFVLEMSLPSGMHQYKFVVDGQWVADPDNSTWAANPFGTVNSVARLD